MLWAFICAMRLIVYYCDVPYQFSSESAIYSCLNVKGLLLRNRRDIWILSDSNETWTHNQSVRKWTLNYLSELANWLSWSSLTLRQIYEYRFTQKAVHDMIKACSQMHRTDDYSQRSSIIWPVWLNDWVFVCELSGCGFASRCCHFAPVSSKEFLDIQATIACRFTRKPVIDMVITVGYLYCNYLLHSLWRHRF